MTVATTKAFQEGDVVSRITGSLLMTVEDERHDKFIACVWFNAANEVQRDCFAPETLQKWVREISK